MLGNFGVTPFFGGNLADLVIPDSHRNLYPVRHAQIAGHTVILGAQAGLLPYGDPELFVPFLEDT